MRHDDDDNDVDDDDDDDGNGDIKKSNRSSQISNFRKILEC